MSDRDNRRKTSKVRRVMEEYGLTDMGDTLEARWVDDADGRYSLRELADFFNQEVLRAVLRRNGVSKLEGEVENTYRLLTDGSVSSGVRTQTENSLARNGVDVERLRKDFVSHQAIHTYLTKYRGVTHESTDDSRTQIEKSVDTVRRLRNRTTAVTETTLGNLRDTDRITLGEFDVLVDLRVVCNSCGRSYPVDELLAEGGCDCDAESA